MYYYNKLRDCATLVVVCALWIDRFIHYASHLSQKNARFGGAHFWESVRFPTNGSDSCRITSTSHAWQITQPDTLAHELGDNVYGLLRHHGIELHQLVVAESLHDLSLLQEGLRGHGSWLQSLHRYLGGTVPHAWHTDKGMLMHALYMDTHRDILCRHTHQFPVTLTMWYIHIHTYIYIYIYIYIYT